MNVPTQYRYYGRIGIIFLASGGFFLLSLYARALTEHNIFPILFPAVALSAWVGGRLGGLISTMALSLGTAYYHMPPEGFTVGDPADMVRLGTFTLSGAFVAWLSGALKDHQGIMMATLKSIGDAVIATDRHGCVRFLNPIAETLTGWSQKDAKGRPLAEVFQGVHTDTGSIVQLPVPAALREVVALPENIHLISKSGGQVPIDDSLAPVQIESGRILGSILVFRDATRRRQNEAALLESERQRLQAQRMETIGRLAGGVAHDFNNLLTIMNGYADLVLKQIDCDDERRIAIEEIRKAGERAAGLTRQLLVFGRGQTLKLEAVDLNQVVANFEKMLRRLIGEDIELVTILCNESLPVLADVGQIEQVIMNLAVNARDAMPVGGRLTLETRATGPDENCARPVPEAAVVAYAVLTVTDTGSGINPEAKRHLFEPFFTTKEVGKGTGLGLSVIYGIVKSHKGQVQFKSEPGRGSVFEVWLPRAEALPEEARTLTSPQAVPRGSGTILLVEDNLEVRKLVQEILTGLGYLVIEAAHAEEAILAIERHPEPIDLMVSDIVMPGLGGFELAERLALIRPGMRVLYMSGYADHEAVTRALGDPTVAYLHKPFGPDELASKVAEMISRSTKSGAD
jgi:two-component system, cell cycle sensor histidine kinase and response regulator CckA